MLKEGDKPFGERLLFFIKEVIAEVKNIFKSIINIVSEFLKFLNITISIPASPFQIQLNLGRSPLVFLY